MTLGLFLKPDAVARIGALPVDRRIRTHALEVVIRGFTVIKGAASPQTCRDAIAAFRRFEAANEEIFAANRDQLGHYPRIVNLHFALPELADLFSRTAPLLAVQDVLFGVPVALYTSLFYETGSQQPLHRDTPVFCTRPEYLYFGTTVYLEPAGDQNGCLEVMEYGHTIPEVDREAMARRRYGSLDSIPPLDGQAWNEYQASVVAEGRRRGLLAKELHVEAGDALIWHPQLPHGGTPIKDPSRTRFSLVMHTTPAGVPVYHQQAFFNPSKPFPEQASWGYREENGRKIADFRHGISFGHVNDYALDRFRRPSPATA
jgi:phytanoyl-CoA hydroxylase